MDGPAIERMIKEIRGRYCITLTELQVQEKKAKERYEKYIGIARRLCSHESSDKNPHLCMWCGADLEKG